MYTWCEREGILPKNKETFGRSRFASAHKVHTHALYYVGGCLLPLPLACQSGSQYVHHFCDGFKTLINHSSSPGPVEIKNSSAIDWGAAPRSKTDEFGISTILGDEL